MALIIALTTKLSLSWRHASKIRRLSSSSTVNLSNPHLWYDEARLITRKVIVHVGPTNSGKTYSALKRLKQASNGIYCGPLRLLAWEVSERLRAEGYKCNLLTGNERDFFECGGTQTACTIEMADLGKQYDIGIIDEVQLIGDIDRGWAWTQAFLGLRAAELHLCGSLNMLPVVEELCRMTGDTVEIHKYDRLSPLVPTLEAVGYYSNLRSGDCVVGFSRKALYEIKRQIEIDKPGVRCCVIYGSMPPEARQGQARLFGDPNSGYDILVASDAVGMGLNLAIKRIVFTTMEKFDGRRRRLLKSTEVKQIAGRAGRFGSAFEVGEVACMESDDVMHMVSSLQKDDRLIFRAGLFPSSAQLELWHVLSIYSDAVIRHNHTTDFDAILRELWYDDFRSEWDLHDTDMPESAGSEVEQGLTVGMVQKKFGSIRSFSRELGVFLQSRLRSSRGWAMSSYSSSSSSELPQYDAEHNLRAPLADLLKEFRSGANLDESDNLYFMCDVDERIRLAQVLDEIDDRIHTSYLRRLELTKKNKDRFIDLDDLDESTDVESDGTEETVVAPIRGLHFRDKYQLCMAPINVDCDLQLKWYRRFLQQFSYGKAVHLSPRIFKDVFEQISPLTKKIISGAATVEKSKVHAMILDQIAYSEPMRDANIAADILQLERAHAVLEMYIWLSHRQRAYFVDLAAAKAGCVLCAGWIEEALSTVSSTNWKKKDKMAKARGKKSDKSYIDGDDDWENDGKEGKVKDKKKKKFHLKYDYCDDLFESHERSSRRNRSKKRRHRDFVIDDFTI